MTDGERVAVEIGTAALRVAAGGAGGAPVLLADLPRAGAATPAELPRVLAALVPGRPAELVLVHPARWPAARVATWVGAATVAAHRVRALPVPAAVAGPRCGVLDVGRTGAEAALLGPDGRVRAVRWCPGGGDALDAAVAAATAPAGPDDARRTREALSLLPVAARAGGGGRVDALALRPALTEVLAPAVAALRALTAGPVVLVGGVARAPLLAELLDDAGIGPVTVAPRPDVAAVLGAARGPRPPRPRPVAAPARPAFLPPPPRPRRALPVLAAAAAVAAVLAVPAARAPRPPAPAPGVLVQYGYELRLPAGWAHTGGLPERRRSVLTPVGAPAGSDLVAVERTPLGYDTGAEPARAVAELRAAFDAATGSGAALSGFDAAAEVGGRPVVGYHQAGAPGTTAVDWYVVLDGDAQLSVGCRYTPAGRAAVARACAVVVASLRRSG